MTEERFAFVEDVKTRKNIAKSAAHKKSGAKSKKCNFPSDYLTRKEKETLNGTMKVWDLKKFYTTEQFLEMPEDIQVSYINYVTKTWSISTRTVSSILFGKNSFYLNNYARYHNLQFESHGVSGHSGKKFITAFAEAVQNSVKNEIIESADEIYTEVKEEKPVEVTPEPQKEEPIYPMERAEFVMNDHIDYLFLNTLHEKFGGKCKITIIIERR